MNQKLVPDEISAALEKLNEAIEAIDLPPAERHLESKLGSAFHDLKKVLVASLQQSSQTPDMVLFANASAALGERKETIDRLREQRDKATKRSTGFYVRLKVTEFQRDTLSQCLIKIQQLLFLQPESVKVLTDDIWTEVTSALGAIEAQPIPSPEEAGVATKEGL